MKKRLCIASVLVLFAILLLGGCASGEKTAALLNSSTHINQVISSFGPPTNVIPTQDGGSVYVWSQSQTVTYNVPQYGSQQHYGYAGQYLGSSYGQTGYTTNAITSSCEVRVMINSAGRILNWSGRGDACP